MIRGRLTLPEVIDRFIAYHSRHDNWGQALHIALDDDNVDDSSILFCIRTAIELGDTEAELLARIMLQLTKTQRGKIKEFHRRRLWETIHGCKWGTV